MSEKQRHELHRIGHIVDISQICCTETTKWRTSATGHAPTAAICGVLATIFVIISTLKSHYIATSYLSHNVQLTARFILMKQSVALGSSKATLMWDDLSKIFQGEVSFHEWRKLHSGRPNKLSIFAKFDNNVFTYCAISVSEQRKGSRNKILILWFVRMKLITRTYFLILIPHSNVWFDPIGIVLKFKEEHSLKFLHSHHLLWTDSLHFNLIFLFKINYNLYINLFFTRFSYILGFWGFGDYACDN